MRSDHRNLRFRILILSGVTLSLVFLSLGFMLRLSWVDFLENRKREAAREAITGSTLLQAALLDASKILDVAKTQLEASLARGPMDQKQIHDILHSAVENFSIYNTQDAFGLLLFVDNNGRLLARSIEYPARELDFSDRNYYLDLRNNPSRKYAVGRLRRAVTTGRLIFHLSMPVHRPDKSFAGVVAVQLDENQLATTLGKMLAGSHERRLCILCPDGRPLFVYPEPDAPLDSDDPEVRTLHELSAKANDSREVITIRAGTPGFPKTTYVTFQRDPLFGTTTWTCVAQPKVRADFLKGNLPLILFSTIAILGIGSLFIGLYRQARRLEQALHQATTDPGTGLPNRRALEIRASTLWLEAGRHGKPITVLFLDIDHFKEFNDTWGHHAGDRVLKLVAGLLRKCTDRPLDFFCRWGGEEFLILLPETGIQGALTITRRIQRALRHIRLGNGGRKLPPVTISVGIASTEHAPAASSGELIERADLKMLEAKASGRNRIFAEGIGEEVMAPG
jgi:diguanylate cyclase (GGDEF)-like protein